MERQDLQGSGIEIRTTTKGGDFGRIVALHGRMYRPEDGFGPRFEAYVARTVAEFVLDNDAGGRVWLAERGERLVGCAAVAHRDDNSGQLRWVLVDDSVRGQGLGRALVKGAIDYCVSCGFDCVRLQTTDGLPASMQLYRQLGFRTVSDELQELWDGPRRLIVMEKQLGTDSV